MYYDQSVHSSYLRPIVSRCLPEVAFCARGGFPRRYCTQYSTSWNLLKVQVQVDSILIVLEDPVLVLSARSRVGLKSHGGSFSG